MVVPSSVFGLTCPHRDARIDILSRVRFRFKVAEFSPSLYL